MMNSRVLSLSLDDYETNRWVPFAAAFGFHIFLLIWDPTILKASPYIIATPMITVKVMDHLPVMEQPKPVPPKPIEKKVEKHHKAKKSGLSRSMHPEPVAITRHHAAVAKPSAPKPFVSKIEMPKFVPHETDEPIAASPLPGPAAAPATHRLAAPSMGAPIKLKGKSRGVRAQDIPFELADRGGVAAMGGAVVAIPVGEEKSDVVALPSAQIHESPKARSGMSSYKYQPGQGSNGSGELMGHDKSGKIGFYGAVKADAYVEGSLTGVEGKGKGGKVVAGKGFEIGGPVGDRRIAHRKLPEYPAWAEEKGISAMVKIYFTVKPDGTLRSNMRIMQSSGYAELDDLAKEALAQWRFSATSADSSESAAWGVITFRFTLA